MMPGLYSAATALDTAAQNQDVIANNLANVTMPGYRRQALAFEPFSSALSQASNPATTLGTQIAQTYTVFTPGPVQHTGNSLDLAIQGDGFLVVNGPSGPLYTRNGAFTLSPTGQIQTVSGYAVAGQDGPLTVPTDTRNITITGDGRVMVNHSEVGRLQVADFANPNQLIPAGAAYFQAPAGVTPSTGKSTVLQGYREGSNVQIAGEMAKMIMGLRQYEASQRVLKALSESLQQQTSAQSA